MYISTTVLIIIIIAFYISQRNVDPVGDIISMGKDVSSLYKFFKNYGKLILTVLVSIIFIILFYAAAILIPIGVVYHVATTEVEKPIISNTTYTPGYYVSGPNKGLPTGYCDVCGRPDSAYEQ